MKEISGVDDSGKSDRIMDKLESLEKQNHDLELKIIEAKNTTREHITTEDIRNIVKDVVSSTTDGQIGLLHGLKEIHAVSKELIDLGIVEKPNPMRDKESFEERKWKKDVELTEKERERTHAMEQKEAEVALAKQETARTFIKTMMDIAREPPKKKDDEKEKDEEAPKNMRSPIMS